VLLFGFYSLVNDDADGTSDMQIVVDDADVEWLRQNWIRQWNRPPTLQELQGLVDAHIREEVYYREALAIGLDSDDTIIRRRLVQKMEFLSEDLALAVEPTDEALLSFFEENAEDYLVPPLQTFSHIYFNFDRRGDAAQRDAEQALNALADMAPPPPRAPERGDGFMLPYDYTAQSPQDIARQFGQEFSLSVATLEPGLWHGPITSGFGLHLVYITERTESELPDFDQIRDFILRDFDTDRRKRMNEALYASLRARYDIDIQSTVLTDAEDRDPSVDGVSEEVGR